MNKKLILKIDSDFEFQFFEKENRPGTVTICLGSFEDFLKITFFETLGFSYELENDFPPLYLYEIKNPEIVEKKLIEVYESIPTYASFHFYQIVDSHDNVLFEIVAESVEIFKESKSSQSSVS